MRNLKALLLGSVAFACVGVASETANAQSFAFGAGATFPQFVYRQLFDCLYSQVPGGPAPLPGPYPISSACPSFNQSGLGGEILYAPTGSGNGKASLLSNNVNTIGTPSNSAPYTDPSIGATSPAGYDGIQFAGSDDIVNAKDVSNWAAAGNQTKFGNLIQIPAVIGVVGVGFNGKDGAGNALSILPATPTGGSSGLNLSRNALCGIVSGHITQWDNPILTALNTATPGTAGTTPYGHGNITLVHRTDGSGTTFLFSNALATQCQFEFGPTSETNATVVSYAMPWTDHAGACPFPVAHGANQLNWPDQFPTDQCGNTVPNTGGGHFANASGSGSLVNLVGSTNGAIGYASADFWLPVRTTTGAMATANIPSQWDITIGNNQFEPPTFQGGQIAMSSATPVFNDTTRPLPLAWSLEGVVPNPVVQGSYPISGFTWFEMYQCYQPHANGNNALRWLLTSLNFVYGSSSTAFPIMNANGFANVPGNWVTEIYTLINNSTYGVNYAGTGACSSITQGAY
jgi:phosphate transport system substrate-binding protein